MIKTASTIGIIFSVIVILIFTLFLKDQNDQLQNQITANYAKQATVERDHFRHLITAINSNDSLLSMTALRIEQISSDVKKLDLKQLPSEQVKPIKTIKTIVKKVIVLPEKRSVIPVKKAKEPLKTSAYHKVGITYLN